MTGSTEMNSMEQLQKLRNCDLAICKAIRLPFQILSQPIPEYERDPAGFEFCC